MRTKQAVGDIINLRQARKDKARLDKERTAEANRARFGRTRAQRLADQAHEQKARNALDGAFLEGEGKGAD